MQTQVYEKMLETIEMDEEDHKDAPWLMRDVALQHANELDSSWLNLMYPLAVISVVNTVSSYCFLFHSCFFNELFKIHSLTHILTYSAILVLFVNYILGMRQLHKSQKHNSFVKLLLSTFFVWQLHLSQYSNSKVKSLPVFKMSIFCTYLLQTLPVSVMMLVL